MKTDKLYINRMDNALDTLNQRAPLGIKMINKNLKILKKYDNFLKEHLDDIEYLVESMNKRKFLWVQIDNNEFIDIYTIEYENGLSEDISNFDLLNITISGAVKLKNSIIGLNKIKIKELSNSTHE